MRKASIAILLITMLMIPFAGEAQATVIGREGNLPTWEGAPTPPYGTVAASPSMFGGPARAPLMGSHPVLIILVEFNDQSPVGSTESDWYAKWFGATGSVADYYDEVSYGQLSVVEALETFGTPNNGVIGWLPLAQNHPDTGPWNDSTNRELSRAAMIAADPFIDFSAYDTDSSGAISSSELSIVVIAAGYEASYSVGVLTPNVWGHRWALFNTEPPTLDGVTVGAAIADGGYMQYGEWHQSIYDSGHMATIGIMAHELGHDFGLPDLYDIDGSSEGIGKWGLMGSGSWGTAAGYPGNSPSHLCAWSKTLLGFLTPVAITEDTTVSLPGVAANATVFRVNTSAPDQYFLIENRQPTGYDQGLPITSGGIMIWHIDDSVGSIDANNVNINENRKRVDVEEAEDGALGYSQLDSLTNRGNQRDLFYSGNNTDFNASTTPNSRLYGNEDSKMAISNVSAPSATMTLDIEIIEAVDEDGDGFSPPSDCDDNDENVYPGAPGEMAGDGIDTNCNGQDDCFIATAAYGTEMEGKIDILRAFRDKHLMTNTVGRAFVAAYYKYSPPVAEYIAGHERLRSLTRMLLQPVIGLASLFI